MPDGDSHTLDEELRSIEAAYTSLSQSCTASLAAKDGEIRELKLEYSSRNAEIANLRRQLAENETQVH